MKTLITGGTGFIGKHLIKRLQTLGWEVHCLMRAESQYSELSHVHIHDGTISSMLSIVERTRPKVVFHLASLFLAEHAATDISRLVRSNIELPLQLAEAMATHRVPHLINAATSWQHYQNADYNPVNLYAATKRACIDLLRFYTESTVPPHTFQVTNLELCDTYGPCDPRPKLFSALRNNKSLAMSPGDQLIDLVYIDDVVEALMMAAKHIHTGMETFTVSSGKPRRLREIVELWRNITDSKLELRWGERPYRPREMMTPWSGGRTMPGWTARVGLEEGIKRMEGLTSQ